MALERVESSRKQAQIGRHAAAAPGNAMPQRELGNGFRKSALLSAAEGGVYLVSQMDGGSFPAEHMQQISQVSAAEVELRRNLVQFAPHLVCKLDELLQEERSKMRQQEYEMMYLQEEYQSLKDIFQQRQQVRLTSM